MAFVANVYIEICIVANVYIEIPFVEKSDRKITVMGMFFFLSNRHFEQSECRIFKVEQVI